MFSPGDLTTTPLTGLAQEGIFVSSVREALLKSEIDFAVHSFKDVPTDFADDITLGAVPERVDPRDTFISNYTSLGQLPAGARVGTCSARRAAWVLRNRPDVQVVPIRGNIDNRIAAMQAGDFEAIILAAAGVIRIGRQSDIAEYIEATELVPAPAQGALAIECRTDDERTQSVLGALNHEPSRQAALLERAIFHRIDATDSTAFGVLAQVTADEIRVLADISQSDGTQRFMYEQTATFSEAAEQIEVLKQLENLVVQELEHHRSELVQVG
jgi:hydroxymethylbilane synthase